MDRENLTVEWFTICCFCSISFTTSNGFFALIYAVSSYTETGSSCLMDHPVVQFERVWREMYLLLLWKCQNWRIQHTCHGNLQTAALAVSVVMFK